MILKSLFENDLGFVFHASKNGELEIRHHGKFATRFSGAKAIRYTEQLAQLPFAEQQQLMARLTGNYKRGNEKSAKNHSMNKF
jgi:hypothetical protein